jgi:ubiquinone/menaquinone biosynthesis C-methylase UbiE
MTSETDGRSAAFTAASVPENYDRHLTPVIFEPWADLLLETARVRSGDRVLDVASGTGVVARLAARHAGPDGRVVASDVSATMLAHAAARAASPGGAPIEYLEAAATELPLAEHAFDVVLCQQGLQFFADRAAAAAEMHRVLRPGGAVGMAVWARGQRIEPFDDYADALIEASVDPPFPNAYESSSFVIGPEELQTLLSDAGFAETAVSVVEHTIVWPSAAARAAGIRGTPYGPLVARLPPDRREALELDLLAGAPAAGGEPVRRPTTAVLGRARA